MTGLHAVVIININHEGSHDILSYRMNKTKINVARCAVVPYACFDSLVGVRPVEFCRKRGDDDGGGARASQVAPLLPVLVRWREISQLELVNCACGTVVRWYGCEW